MLQIVVRTARVIGLGLLLAACTGTTTPTTTSTTPPETTTTTAVATTVANTTTSRAASTSPPTTAPIDAKQAAVALVAAINTGDPAAVLDLLDDDAVWSTFGFPVTLSASIDGDLGLLAAFFGLAPDAIGADIVSMEIRIRAAQRSLIETSGCTAEGRTATCDVTISNAFTAIDGRSEVGTLLVEFGASAASSVSLMTFEQGDRTEEADAYERWSAVESPQRAQETLLEEITQAVALLDRWDEAGRPDLPTPDPTRTPIEVVAAYVAARNDQDWPTHMQLLGGEALENPFGSHDEFLSAGVLDRTITLGDCTVTPLGERSFVACIVEVTDIVSEAAGTTPSNPNATTFVVLEGRVVDLPEFLPSLFRGEEAIERWALENQRERYEAACPVGIAGQDVITGLACAEFVAEFAEEWAASVAAAY